ncbi:MAG: hypothetical protein ABJM26_19530 [Anderseniella sp.]
MPYQQVTETPQLKPCILLLTGLWLIVPTAMGSGPAGAQTQPENTVGQQAHASALDSVSITYQKSASVRRVKTELRALPGISYQSRQDVAPRLQSRIRKNSEFAAFVKLVEATSDRKYSPEELRRLYLSFKEWSQNNGAPSQ